MLNETCYFAGEICPAWIGIFAAIGMVLLYLLIGWGIWEIIEKREDLSPSLPSLMFLWPLVIVIYTCAWIYSLITLPYEAARKSDLDELKKEIKNLKGGKKDGKRK